MLDGPIDRHMVEAYLKRGQKNVDEQKDQGSTTNSQNLESSTAKGDTPADNQIDKQKGLDMALYSVTRNKMDVAEVYSLERVTRVAEQFGLKPGWSLDLTTTDENGRPWDFDCVYMRNKVARKLIEDRPMLVIGSPMCTEFSSWMHVNHPRMAKEIVEERLPKARMHLEFCTKLYNLQIHHGRYFLHEHPQSATSWGEQCIQNVLGRKGVIKVSADQCQYGLMSRDKTGEGVVRKATSFMTYAPYVAMELQRRCPNRLGKIHHRHVTLEGGRTTFAQVYPEELCKAICKGLLNQNLLRLPIVVVGIVPCSCCICN